MVYLIALTVRWRHLCPMHPHQQHLQHLQRLFLSCIHIKMSGGMPRFGSRLAWYERTPMMCIYYSSVWNCCACESTIDDGSAVQCRACRPVLIVVPACVYYQEELVNDGYQRIGQRVINIAEPIGTLTHSRC